MTESEIVSAVIKVVAEKMGVDEDGISSDTRFTEDLNADSLDTVELVMDIEDELRSPSVTRWRASCRLSATLSSLS